MNIERSLSQRPKILVFSTLFPHPGQPNAGLFIRERMFRVGERLPLKVVAPVAWFPLQGLIRLFAPNYRPVAPYHEVQDGVDVYHPRFLAIPGLLRSLDGLFMALGCLPTLYKIRRQFNFNFIDAHFAYPDGYAATLLGKWLNFPVTITLRGTEVPLSRTNRRALMIKALQHARHIFSVTDSLKRHVMALGVDGSKIQVVGNGVDTSKFQPVAKTRARRQFGIPAEAKVLISVGGLVERKGFHRVIECLPGLRQHIPDLHYLIVGGASGEGDWTQRLKQQVKDLSLEDNVHFLGIMPPSDLKIPLSAADIFVLATRNEGWANVFLEAMACGLPVITTDVGGNREVICSDDLGTITPFGNKEQLQKAILNALSKIWDRSAIINYAKQNSWNNRVDIIVSRFCSFF